MAAPKRTQFEIQRDRKDISELYLQGKTQFEIAEELNRRYCPPEQELKPGGVRYTLTRQTISRDLLAIQSEWMAHSLQNFNELKAKELAKLDRLELEYWRAWERSCKVKRRTKSEKTERRKQTRQSAQVFTEDMLGDPRYLTGVYDCINRRCELLGLDAPKRMSVMSGSLDKIPFGTLTKDQLNRLANGEDPEKVIPGFKLN
jgi:hypothetical protein